MKRYSLVSYQDASPEVRALYEDYLTATGATEIPIWVQSLGSDAILLNAYWERTKGSLLHGTLPLLMKEMVIFVVSVENGSRYCSAAHAHAVLSLDKTLTFEQLMSITDPISAAATLPETYHAAIVYALAVSRDQNNVPDEVWHILEDADFFESEIDELQSVVDLAMMFNSYSSAKRLPVDPSYRPVLDPIPA